MMLTEGGGTSGTAKVVAAIEKARPNFSAVTKSETAKIRTKEGGSFSYTYAPLEAVIGAVQVSLAAEGVGITGWVDHTQHALIVALVMQDGSGSITSSWALPESGTPQEIGSAISYGRRYCLTTMLNLAAEDDTDARGVGERHPRREKPAPARESREAVRGDAVERTAVASPPMEPPNCPSCGGEMWDNREQRELDKAAHASGEREKTPRPAFSCKDKDACKGVIWSSAEYANLATVDRARKYAEKELNNDQHFIRAAMKQTFGTDVWAQVVRMQREELMAAMAGQWVQAIDAQKRVQADAIPF